jgi:hypothetical protein
VALPSKLHDHREHTYQSDQEPVSEHECILNKT